MLLRPVECACVCFLLLRCVAQSRVAEAEASSKLADSERKAAEAQLAEAAKEVASLRSEMSGMRTAKVRTFAWDRQN